MATINGYTDLEQSKKLAEILPLETADMFYCYGMDIHTKKWDYDITPTIIDVSNQIDIGDIPCWSLAALLIVLPNYQLQTQDDGIGILCSCNRKFNIITANNPIDACVAMILKLHELKML